MKIMNSFRVVILFVLCGQISSSAIPIWELLSHQEKIGQLMYLFLHLVDVYCKNSPIPDCENVLTLYGTSNLINQREDILDLMDPYQRNAREIMWSHLTNGAFELPSEMRHLPFPTNPHTEVEEEKNQIGDYDINFPDYTEYQDGSATPSDPHPYAVRVPAPNSVLKQENYNVASRSPESLLIDHEHSLTGSPKIAAVAPRTLQKSAPEDTSIISPSSFGNFNPKQNEIQKSASKVHSGDRVMATEGRQYSERETSSGFAEPRSHINSSSQPVNPVQNSYKNEPFLIRILKT